MNDCCRKPEKCSVSEEKETMVSLKQVGEEFRILLNMCENALHLITEDDDCANKNGYIQLGALCQTLDNYANVTYKL